MRQVRVSKFLSMKPNTNKISPTMSYSAFTFSKLKSKYNIEQEETLLFQSVKIEEVTPSQHLQIDLEEAKGIPMFSEKAKSESIIAPILRELKRRNPHITVFSGYTFDIPGEDELTGAPDFMISAKPRSPIFCLFESKNKAPEEGYAQ